VTPKLSYLPHHFAFFMLVIILFASFYPFSGWMYSGRPLFEFLFYPLPYYFTFYDNLVNFLAYLPYGFSIALSFKPRWFGWLLAVIGGALTSLSIEFVQQFIASRIASNLDILFNAAGALVGASLAISPLLRRLWHRLWNWRRFLIIPGGNADFAVLLVLVWFIAQLNPSVPLFGVVIRPVGLPQPFISPLENPGLFLVLVEAAGAMLHLMALMLFVSSFLTQRWLINRVLLTLVGLTLCVKLVGAWGFLKPLAFFEWFNSSVMMGLSLGVLLVMWAVRWPRWLRALTALLSLIASQWVASLWPLQASPTDLLSYFRWHYGHLSDIGALVEFLSRLWPWATTICLVWALAELWHRRSQLRQTQ
jgi:VanZ family protein